VRKSGRIRWAGNVALMGEGRGVYRFLMWKPENTREHLGEPDVDGEKILSWIFRKWNVVVWTG